jgi:hypothetical protein
VTTGAGTTVTGGFYGIYSRNDGSGALTIKAYGDVEGTNIVGINARNYGTDLGVTTGVGTTRHRRQLRHSCPQLRQRRSDRHRRWRCRGYDARRHLCAEF